MPSIQSFTCLLRFLDHTNEHAVLLANDTVSHFYGIRCTDGLPTSLHEEVLISGEAMLN